MPNRLLFLAPTLTPGSPAEHLLDRCLAGYPRDGAYRPRLAPSIRAFIPQADPQTLPRRVQDLDLGLATDLATELPQADAALVVWNGRGQLSDHSLLDRVLRHLPSGSACFVHGLLANHREDATQLLDLAASRDIRLTAATSLSTTPRLPDLRLRYGASVTESLVVVQGPDDEALLDGVEALQPDLENAGVLFDLPLVIRSLRGDAVWNAADRDEWPLDLLAAALSRSNTPQGLSVTDGRTQNLMEAGVVRRLATNPRAWLTVHPDGSHSTIVALDGAVFDVNLAIRLRRGSVVSTQLYRPPAPNRAEFGELLAAIDDFFRRENHPWSNRRALSAATWHAALRGERGVRN